MTIKKEMTRFNSASDSAKKLVSQGATIGKNVEWIEGMPLPKSERIGATIGGVDLDIENTTRSIEYDGFAGFDVAGNQLFEGSTVSVNARVAEMSNDLLSKIIKADVKELSDGRSRIIPRAKIQESDYYDTLVFQEWFNADGADEWRATILHNVLVTSNLSLKTAPNSDQVVDVTFTAHATTEDIANGRLPYEIITPASHSEVLPFEYDQEIEGGE